MKENKTKKRRRTKANGFGTIKKLSGNRTKPYGALVTIGYDRNGKQIRKYIGFGKTKSEAEMILTKYLAKPYNIDVQNITFKNLYNEWVNEQLKLQERQKNGEPIKSLSHKGLQRYIGVFNNYYQPLYYKQFNEISNTDIQNIVDACQFGFHTKSDIKGLYNKLKDYKESRKTTNTKYINIGYEEKSNLHKPFTEEEIKKLWENTDYGYVEAILIQIYTGLRPSALLKIKEINLKEMYIIGGIKTNAGIDRMIPIHESIAPLLEKWVNNGQLNISYPTYRKRFVEAMKYLNMDHTPHDCRHTTATLLDKYKANATCIKLILGHQDNDVTTGVYTHKTITELREAINLLPSFFWLLFFCTLRVPYAI